MEKDWWSKHSSWLIGLLCLLVSSLWFYMQLRVWKEEGHDHMLTVANVIVTCGLWSLLIVVALYRKKARKPSRLRIHNADYRALDGQGISYDVTECLQRMIHGDSLVLDIENDGFHVDGHNYVPKDPFFGVMKRLHVTYSFDGVSATAIRPEQTRIVLPEDSFIASAVSAIPRIPFSQFQLETFQLAKEILDFLRSYEPIPPLLPSESDPPKDSIARRGQWRTKLRSAFDLRFKTRLETMWLKFGEKGISMDRALMSVPPGQKRPERELAWNAIALIAMAHQLDGLPIQGRTDWGE
jgi:hypothetical protein